METFPAVPSFNTWRHQFARLLPDAAGVSLVDSSLHIGSTACITLHSAHDVIASRRHLMDDMAEIKRAQTRQREATWSPIDIADNIGRSVSQASHQIDS